MTGSASGIITTPQNPDRSSAHRPAEGRQGVQGNRAAVGLYV